MRTYIALLRGVNVSGTKKIKMADLKVMLEEFGFANVQTYIQSGNIIFKSESNKDKELAEKIKNGIHDVFGFDVPVLVKTKTEIIQILEESPYKKAEDIAAKKIYYTLLKSTPKQENITQLDQKKYPNELFKITKNCVYLNCLKGAGNAKLNNNSIERKLKVQATTRNHRTMLKLIEISEEI